LQRGGCISKAGDRTPLQKDQDRFQSMQGPDQPVREIRYLDNEGKKQHYWARRNEALPTEGRSIMKRQCGVGLDV
jgi:hypothetical protein